MRKDTIFLTKKIDEKRLLKKSRSRILWLNFIFLGVDRTKEEDKRSAIVVIARKTAIIKQKDVTINRINNK